MHRTFILCLFLMFCAAFAVTGALAFWQFKSQAEQQAEQLMVTRLNDILELVDYTRSGVQRLRNNNEEMARARTRALAEIVRLNPATLSEQEVLQGICNDIGAEQAAITDEKGVIIAAVPTGYLGLDLSKEADAGKLMPCISTPGLEYVQPAEAPHNQSGLLYVSVYRQDAPGLVRAGFRPYREQRSNESASYGKLAANRRLGTTGRIISFRGGAPLNREALPGPAADFLALPLGQLRRMTFNGEEHFVYALERKNIRMVGILPFRDFYPSGMRNLRSRLLTNSIVFLSVFLLMSFLLHHFVIRRIAKVNETLRRITEGDMAVRVNENSSPEFVRLSTGINAMLDSIKVMNDQGRERLRKELELARFMQRNALPSALPEHSEFQIEATLLPAASVGGDFYDVFMADDDHLTFMVAAVSGTGVPAALFMMRSLSIIRNFARSGQEPSAVLAGANRLLCEGRTEDMHVSVFYGSLELSTGLLTCVNAGHEKPLLQRLGEGGYSELALPQSPVLGAREGVPYRSHQLQLAPGDRLLLYTDGLPRAQNANKELFSKARLLEALQAEALTLVEVPNLVRKAIRRFTLGMPQEDDITLLALEYRSIMRHGGKVRVQASEADAVRKLLQESLESVFAAPVDIDALQEAAKRVLSALPPETHITAVLGCNETHAELAFFFPRNVRNPLEHLNLTGIDSSHFSRMDEGNHLILSKTLG